MPMKHQSSLSVYHPGVIHNQSRSLHRPVAVLRPAAIEREGQNRRPVLRTGIVRAFRSGLDFL